MSKHTFCFLQSPKSKIFLENEAVVWAFFILVA